MVFRLPPGFAGIFAAWVRPTTSPGSVKPAQPDLIQWIELTQRTPWIDLPVGLFRQLRLTLGVVVLLVSTAPAQETPGPTPPAPAPYDERPTPVVLDPAMMAKLRASAFDAARAGDIKPLADYFKTGQPAEITNDRGDTLLILAAYHGRDEAVKLILEQPKTPIDARNKMGFTALTGAAYKGYIGIVKQLAVKQADLNSTNERKQTALMYAAMFGRTEVVKYLVEQKVDVKARDNAGKTARDLARLQGSTDAEKILEAAEKSPPPSQ